MNKEEAERFFPRMSGNEFKRELYIVESDATAQVGLDMLDLKGWRVVGWALTNEVARGGNWRYICMFESERGLRYWNQVATFVFCRLAELTKTGSANRS